MTRILCSSLLLASLAVVSIQAAPYRGPVAPLEDERNADRPALVWRTGSSPGMISSHGNFTSYQVNVDANGLNITGDAANEPSIAIDPTNSNIMTIGWRQFNTISSNFRQGGFAYTSNHGVSWTFPGVLSSDFRSDPVLCGDAAGKFFYLSLVPNFYDDIWRSDSGGQSWSQLGPATGGDKQWFVIDNTNSAGHGFLYQSWSSLGNNYDGRQFTRSVDGGFTWLDPIDIPSQPSRGTLDVDANGTLFIGGSSLRTGWFWCVRSTDAKNSAVVPTFDQSTHVNLGGYPLLGSSINPEGLAGQTFLAVDRSGTGTNNNVYMLASVRPYGTSNATDVMFAKSTDGGATFSTARRINDDAINHDKWHWFGTLAVAPNGRIDVVWLDSRNAANNTDSQLFYSYSTDGGDTWSTNVSVSDPFNPFLGYPSQQKIGDYITIVSDNDGGNVAYCATFNLEEDIYYVRVSPSAVTPSPFAIRSITRDENAVTITFRSEIGKTYRCEYNDVPASPWGELETNIVGTGGDVSVEDPAGATKLARFYRIVQLN